MNTNVKVLKVNLFDHSDYFDLVLQHSVTAKILVSHFP